MARLLRHKILLIIVIGIAVYALNNPSGRFGWTRKGLVVYNRIPVVFFDCSIDHDGRLYLEADLSQPVNFNYWFENHLSGNHTDGPIPLIIGTGFGDSLDLNPDRNQLRKCRNRRFEPTLYPSREAIARFEELRSAEKKCVLLLKVK